MNALLMGRSALPAADTLSDVLRLADLLAKSVPEDQIFDDRAIREAKQRLDDKNPFI